jgi:hypothetical protein
VSAFVLAACLSRPSAAPLLENPMKPEERYAAWVAAKDPSATGTEMPSLALGGFRFFSVATSRGKRLEAAVSELTLVAKDGTGDWASFLRAGPPDAVAQRIAWLQGTPSLIVPSSPSLASFEKTNPGVTRAVTEPRLDEAGATVRFDAWYVFQPSAQVSHLVVDARADGATLTWTPYGR